MNKIQWSLIIAVLTIAASSSRPVSAFRPSEADIARDVEAHKCVSGWTEADKMFTPDERCAIRDTAVKSRSRQESKYFALQEQFAQAQEMPVDNYEAFQSKADAIINKIARIKASLNEEIKGIERMSNDNAYLFRENVTADKTMAARELIILSALYKDRMELKTYIEDLEKRVASEKRTRRSLDGILRTPFPRTPRGGHGVI